MMRIFYALWALVHCVAVYECHSIPMNINELYWQKVMWNMNQSADPCEDFYEYACGNWMANYDNANEYLDVPGYMDHEVNRELQDLLHRHQHDETTSIYKKLWQYYQSCVQLAGPELNDYLHLLEDDLNFEWPMFRSNWSQPWANDTHFDWLSTIATLRVYGLNGEFITMHVNSAPQNSSHFLIELQQHLPTQDLKAKDVASIFRMFGFPDADSDNITAKIMTLAEKLNKLKLPLGNDSFVYKNDTRAYMKSFVEMPLSELMARVPHLNWLKYFHIVFGRPLNVSEHRVQCNSLQLTYFDELTQVLSTATNETICYYLMLKFMYHINDDLPLAKTTFVPCIKHLRGYMPLAMNFLYEEHIYKPLRQSTDAALHAMYQNLRRTFEQLLAENHLRLNSRECDYILDELQQIRLKIGNIPTGLNHTFVEQYYEDIVIDPNNFHYNHLQVLKHYTRIQQNALWQQPDVTNLSFFEHDPNTSSSSSPVKVFYNAVLVPYGFLQLPLYHADLHALYQYSLFGVILAHEITHAYDLFHIVYDVNSNYNQLGLDIAQHFKPYLNCTKEEPSVSVSENIADVVGLRLAYHTYFNDIYTNTSNAEDLLLHGESGNFTIPQMFFINSVQFLCANMAQLSDMNVEAMNLGHDMHDARVRQNWANYEKFAGAFNCPAGTAMHPQQFCRLW